VAGAELDVLTSLSLQWIRCANLLVFQGLSTRAKSMETEAGESTRASARVLREMWEHKTDERLSAAWEGPLVSAIEKYGYSHMEDALQAVAARLLRHLRSSAEPPPVSIGDVVAYAAVSHADELEPGVGECYLIRGHVRKKFIGGDDGEMLAALLNAMRNGMSVSAMHKALDENDTLEDCFAALGVERSPLLDIFAAAKVRKKVLVRFDEPECVLGMSISARQPAEARR